MNTSKHQRVKGRWRWWVIYEGVQYRFDSSLAVFLDVSNILNRTIRFVRKTERNYVLWYSYIYIWYGYIPLLCFNTYLKLIEVYCHSYLECNSKVQQYITSICWYKYKTRIKENGIDEKYYYAPLYCRIVKANKDGGPCVLFMLDGYRTGHWKSGIGVSSLKSIT